MKIHQLKEVEKAIVQLQKALGLSDKELYTMFSKKFHKKIRLLKDYNQYRNTLLTIYKIRKECNIKNHKHIFRNSMNFINELRY